MTAEIGTFLLILALLAALTGVVLPLRVRAAFVQALCVTLAMAVLIALRLDNDFSVENVASHSNLALPVLYKIAGAWGNHEGSMLLWMVVLTSFALVFALRHPDGALRERTLAAQSALSAGVLLFILFTSNPFARLFPPPADGEMLNPLLQDIALAMHPPLLYVGYVGFSLVFSLAVAALLLPLPEGRGDLKNWAHIAHPWILAAWSALTLGIGLGSWWAYRELGWGGFWFWDPVENASLLPWLSGTALLHANIVLKKRGMLGVWVLLLSILTFGLSLLGTFLVRSGALTSVHSFASDPARGLFILAYIAVVIGGALTLFGMRAERFADKERMSPLSREGMIVVNNLFLLTACATVLLGTMYPLLAEWLQDEKLTVGPPYFNATFLPLMILPLLLSGLVAYLPWNRASLAESLRRALPALLAAAAGFLLMLAVVERHLITALAGFALALWMAAASLRWLRVKKSWPVFLGHLGAALLVAGVTGAGVLKQEVERGLSPGESISIGGYTLHFDNKTEQDTPNYSSKQAIFHLTDEAGRALATLTPEYRSYTMRGVATSEVALHSTLLRDVYLAIGEESPDGRRTAVRAYVMPMIGFIWAGVVLMAIGGLIAAMPRRRKGTV